MSHRGITWAAIYSLLSIDSSIDHE